MFMMTKVDGHTKAGHATANPCGAVGHELSLYQIAYVIIILRG